MFGQAFGFEPVTLKPVKTAVQEEPRSAEPQPEKPEPVQVSAAADVKSGKAGRIWFIVLGIAAAIIVAAVILVTLGRSGHLDSLIYSDEELELIQQQGL